MGSIMCRWNRRKNNKYVVVVKEEKQLKCRETKKKEEENVRKLSLVVVEKASLTSSSIKYAGFEPQTSVNRKFNHFWTIKQQHNYVSTQ